MYNVFPAFGSISAHQFVLVVIEFTPRKPKSYESTLNVILNHNSGNPMKLVLRGTCSAPEVSFSNDGRVYFPEAALGVFSKQTMRITNNSKIDLAYEITVPEKYKEELFFEPASGLIKQNENLAISCGFVPYTKKPYKIKPIFKARELLDLTQSMIGYFLPGSGNEDIIEQTKLAESSNVKSIEKQLTVIGKGGDGSISIKPELVDFGIVKVNFSDRITAQLFNDSDCTFFVQVQLVPDTDPSFSSDHILPNDESRDSKSAN